MTFSFCFLIRYCTFGIAPERANAGRFLVSGFSPSAKFQRQLIRMRHVIFRFGELHGILANGESQSTDVIQ